MRSPGLSHRQAAPAERGQALADFADAIVRIHKRFYGKGPVTARAHLSKNLLVVLLEGGLTRTEQTLADNGHTQQVSTSRLMLEQTIEHELRMAVASTLHRSVHSFMCANDPAHDLQTEIFVLEPHSGDRLEASTSVVANASSARESGQQVESRW